MIKKTSLAIAITIMPLSIWASIPSYSAQYTLIAGSASGTVDKSLSIHGDQYQIESDIAAHKMMFSKKMSQISVGTISDGKVQAQQYKTTGDKDQQVTIEPGQYDNLSSQLQIRESLSENPKAQDLSYSVLRDGKIMQETYAVGAPSVLDTPLGSLQVVEVSSAVDANNAVRYWLAPQLDYFVVKAELEKDGKLTMQTMAQSYKTLS